MKNELMMNKTNPFGIIVGLGLCLAFLLAGCGTEPEVDDNFGWLIGGCAGQAQALAEQTTSYDTTCKPETLLPEEIDYCTEKIFWEYNKASQTLQLVHGPVALNCCGVRYVISKVAEGFNTIIEMDEPGDYRCRCMCDTFYSVCLHDVPEAPLPLRIFLHVTDESSLPVDVWEGELDLSQGKGQIALGDSGSLNCLTE